MSKYLHITLNNFTLKSTTIYKTVLPSMRNAKGEKWKMCNLPSNLKFIMPHSDPTKNDFLTAMKNHYDTELEMR